MKKFAIVFLALILLVSVLSGCAKTAGVPESNTQQDSAVSAVADTNEETKTQNKEPVTITYLCAPENYPDRFKDVIAAWEEKTGNKVEVQLFPSAEYQNILKTRMMAGEGPDLYRSDDLQACEIFWPKEWAEDLSDQPWVSRISEGGKAYVTWTDGTIRGIPVLNPGINGMMYNKDIFEQAGITELPETWDEFLECCAKIKAIGITPVNLQGANGSTFGLSHLTMMMFTGIEKIYSTEDMAELADKLNTNQMKLADVPELNEAMDQFQQLIDLGYTNDDPLTNTYEMTQSRFANGEVAMHPCGDFILGFITEQNPDIRIGVMPVPLGDNRGACPIMAGVGLHVNANSKHKEEAIDFFNFFASQEVQTEYMAKEPGMNIFSDVTCEQSMFSADASKIIDEGLAVTRLNLKIQAWQDREWQSILQEFVIGTKTGNEALAEYDKRIELAAKNMNLPGW